MATCIILAGGAGTRMPGDKAFMEVAGRRVIDIQVEVLKGAFDEFLVIGNEERMDRLRVFEREGVRVLEETVRGKGPLGGIASGLALSGSDENFILACDIPFIRREAVLYIMGRLAGCQVAVPETPKGLEPLHAAYRRDCLEVALDQVSGGNLKVTDFYASIAVTRIPWSEFLRFDPTGRLMLNVNRPEDLRAAAGHLDAGEVRG